MFRGEKINVTESRALLHWHPERRKGIHRCRGKNVVPKFTPSLTKWLTSPSGRQRPMERPHRKTYPRRHQYWHGRVDLRPVTAFEALKFYSDRAITFRLVSNIDDTDLVEATRRACASHVSPAPLRARTGANKAGSAAATAARRATAGSVRAQKQAAAVPRQCSIAISEADAWAGVCGRSTRFMPPASAKSYRGYLVPHHT
jgi:hypothetical protein